MNPPSRTAVGLLLAVALLAVAADEPPDPVEVLLDTAEHIAAEINELGDSDVVVDVRGIPVVTVFSPDLTVNAQSALGYLLSGTGHGEAEDKVCGTAAGSKTSYGPLGDETHSSAVAIDWCYTPETGEYDIDQPLVHPDAPSPVVSYRGYQESGVTSGDGSIVVYFCTGLSINGDYVCVDNPNHYYTVKAEGGQVFVTEGAPS